MNTPRFTLSRSRLLEQYRALRGRCDLLAYSSKTNPRATAILEEHTDAMVTIHMPTELTHIKDCSRVIFFAQGWDENLIVELLMRGVRWFVVDNEVDLDALLGTLAGRRERITLLLRWQLRERSLRTERYYVFGMPTEKIHEQIRSLHQHPRIERLGLHFHRKTQNLAEWNFRFELEEAFDDAVWRAIDLVDVGGGLPVAYANTNADVLTAIFERLAKLREWLARREVLMLLEPGRFIAAPAGRLHTRIVAIHGETIIVDASVYNGDLDALIVPVKLLVEGELAKGHGRRYTIKGATPCAMDIFRYRVYLPEQKIADELIFLNAGAYNFSSSFCDLKPVPEEVVD